MLTTDCTHAGLLITDSHDNEACLDCGGVLLLTNPSDCTFVPRRAQYGARVLKLTPTVQQVIVDAIRDGAGPSDAAEYAGITRNTYYSWMKLDGEPYLSFQEAVNRAIAEAVVSASIYLKKAKPEFWIKHMGGPSWAEQTRHVQVEVGGAGGGPIQVAPAAAAPMIDVSRLDKRELETLRILLLKARPVEQRALPAGPDDGTIEVVARTVGGADSED